MSETRIRNTGKIRYRLQSRWFRAPLVILQMEVLKEEYDWRPGQGWSWKTQSIWFRDTTLEDLTTLDLEKKAKPAVGDMDTCFRPLKTMKGWSLVLQIKDDVSFRDATVQDLLLRQYPTA